MNAHMQKKTYSVVITKDIEDGVFIGRCDELHANSQGDTFEEIVDNMKEATELAAEECEKTTDFNIHIIKQ